jgi:hypothetical protein
MRITHRCIRLACDDATWKPSQPTCSGTAGHHTCQRILLVVVAWANRHNAAQLVDAITSKTHITTQCTHAGGCRVTKENKCQCRVGYCSAVRYSAQRMLSDLPGWYSTVCAARQHKSCANNACRTATQPTCKVKMQRHVTVNAYNCWPLVKLDHDRV